ncbi:HAD-IA family hydrolase [Parvularcula sp. LCG005]|uniref:HAD-IA family hydrolase n=1 Tax=Parvularcula sp. LCG005 TaxID=3078805 RepID=UPI00294361FA|nr:HAD-IA family hydrolase [Parvularcula sp. LCG005]WOI52547.1 HAD-IA family hydrolase [Parvularcula sp. LCG005]
MSALKDVVTILDLDGTLVDSAPDLCATLNIVLESQGLEPVPLDGVRALVGEGAVAMMKKGFALQGRSFPDGDEGNALRQQFFDYYETHSTDHSTVFEGVFDALEGLQAEGAALAICTNKIERLSHPLLEKLGLTPYFDEIICRDTLPEHKPSGLPLRIIRERTEKMKGVMVGDTMTDLNAARAAGMPCAWATFGYGSLPDDLGPEELCFDHYGELVAMVKTLSGLSV